MRQPKPKRLSCVDLVEALQLGHAVATLHDLSILTSLAQPSTTEDLARKHRLNAALLRGTLDYVAARTDLVRKTGKSYVATRKYSTESRFIIEMYAGAYIGNAIQLAKVMRRPSLARSLVDRLRLARAFEAVGGSVLGALPGMIRQLEFNNVLDIGCGSAALLLTLATHDREFIGWGLEVNHAMCEVARKKISIARLGKRVRVIEGDSTRLRATLPANIRARVGAVTACQIANEMFGAGSTGAVRWLRGIRRMFPGRPLLISDYYGRLGSKIEWVHRETLLHDYTQLLSGQGVPPADVDEWQAIYSEAGCQLVHAIEDKETTLFVHIARL